MLRRIFSSQRHPQWIILVALAFIGAGCASSGRVAEPPPAVHFPQPDDASDPAAAATEHETVDVERLLREEFTRWEGTPHRWGGISPAGADCSGFILSVYQQVFGMSLPRTTESQAREGAPIGRNELVAGDLVFFRPSKRSNHAGIYLSGGRFAHISSSRGMIVSHLDESYWSRAYWTARRVLPDHLAQVHQSHESRPFDEPPARDRRRGGW